MLFQTRRAAGAVGLRREDYFILTSFRTVLGDSRQHCHSREAASAGVVLGLHSASLPGT
jgi:hypothetical protein